ncbi:5205_t:CDS:2 [Ambispora gerdemannii]|uniref:5205_t:CDS:1 n=1 Tax=Ambispora gerdemannii TaxID=144530 RepID=A0A9N9FNR0_9GLOM|nr:5205_t:CDS:2 [Ambispora gerdemannii]
MFPSEQSNSARMSSLSFFPSLRDITLTPSTQTFYQPTSESADMPSLIWSVINKFWENSDALIAHQNKLYIFRNKDLFEVDKGTTRRVLSGCGKIIAATKFKDDVYISTQIGEIWCINLLTFELRCIIKNLNNVRALVTFENGIFAFGDKLWRIDTINGKCESLDSSDWRSTVSAAVLGDSVYVVTRHGDLWRIDLRDYTKIIIKRGGQDPDLILAYQDNLYLFSKGLYKVNVDGSCEKIEDNLSGILTGVSSSDAMYIIFNSGELFRIIEVTGEGYSDELFLEEDFDIDIINFTHGHFSV